MVSALSSSVFPSLLFLSTRVYIFDPSFLSPLTLLCGSYITLHDITWLLQFHWTATNSGRRNENRAIVTRRESSVCKKCTRIVLIASEASPFCLLTCPLSVCLFVCLSVCLSIYIVCPSFLVPRRPPRYTQT